MTEWKARRFWKAADVRPQGDGWEVVLDDRPLRTPEHFARFAGETVTVKTTGPIDGRSSFTGELLGFEDGCVIVAADGADTFRIPYDNIKKARVKGTIDFSA